MTVGVERKFRNLENRIMEDVVRRIKKTGQITSSADYQLNRYYILGNSTKDIEDIVKSAVGDDYPETFKLYDEVIEKQYTRSKKLYEQVNEEFIPYEQNEQLQQLVNGLIQQSNDELYNITRSMGFMVDMGGGRKVFSPLSDYYNQYLDNAIVEITSGAFDYNTVIRRVVGQMTNSGLRTVDYASGHTSRCDVAARRSIMTGLSQLTGHISQANAQKLHTEYFEVDWHAGARPSHRTWQGKVWSYRELVTVCGLGTVTGLQGANCYHEYYPFIPGISERQFSDGWLAEQNRKEDLTKTFRGKEYTLYEATQRQRYLETNMRAQRQKVKFLQEAGADPDDIILARCKYQAQLDEYKAFCKRMGLQEQRERIYYDLKGRIAPSHDTYQAYLKGELGAVDKSHISQKTQKAAANWAKSHLGVSKTNYTKQSIETVNNANRALQRVYRDYPVLKGFIDEIEFKSDMAATAQASLRLKNGQFHAKLTLSSDQCANEKKIQQIIDHQVNNGYWTDKRGLYGIVKHEGAHLSEYALTLQRYGVQKDGTGGDARAAMKAIKRHEVASEIKQKALSACDLRDEPDIIEKRMCGYANLSSGEFLAEGCSEHNPRKLAKEVQRLFEEEMRKHVV